MSAHTPEPWTFSTEPQPNGCPIIGAGGLMIAMLAHTTNQADQKETAIANARLIAAAPDLLAALDAAVKDAEHPEFEVWLDNERPSGDITSVHQKWQASSEYRSFCEHWQSQITAIAKARGTP